MQTAFLSNFTNVKIKGRVYAVSQSKQMAIYFVYLIQFVMMILIFLPDFGKSLNILPNYFFEYIDTKKWQVAIGVFFIGNFITGMLGNSGAFEVIVNGKLAFSKLNLGRVPNFDELITIIKKMDLQLQG